MILIAYLNTLYC